MNIKRETVPESCHVMQEGEILSAGHSEYPLFEGVLYGDIYTTAKFSKRLSCAIKHLPLRLRIRYEYDTQKAVENGIAKDPSLTIDGKLLLEGLVQAEEITEVFEALLA